MKRSKEHLYQIFLQACLCLVVIMGAGVISRHHPLPPLKLDKQESALNFNNKFLKIFNAGNKMALADFLWIKTLIESDIARYQKGDLNNWMYLRFDSIFTLDPYFIEAYRFAGVYFSIVKYDVVAANEVYKKALEYFPADYYLNYHAAFHYLIDLKRENKALELYKKIMNYPEAPFYIKSLVARLSINQGLSREYALSLLLESIEANRENPIILEKLQERARGLKAEIDLDCLNNGKDNCQETDYFGQPYQLKDGRYQADQPFEKFEYIDKKTRQKRQ